MIRSIMHAGEEWLNAGDLDDTGLVASAKEALPVLSQLLGQCCTPEGARDVTARQAAALLERLERALAARLES